MDGTQINQMQRDEELNALVSKEIIVVKVVADPIFGLLKIHLTGKGAPVYNTLKKRKGN